MGERPTLSTQEKRLTKKQLELALFERAQPHVPSWTPGDLDDTGEEPDLIIRGARTYGVELTAIVRGEMRAQVELRKAICERARRQFVLRGPGGLGVAVVFKELAPLRKSDQCPAARDLAEIVENHALSRAGTPFNLRLVDGVDFKSNHFATIFINSIPHVKRDNWRPSNAWWVPVLTAANIQEEIWRKEVNLPRYLRRVSEVWLLLAADGFNASNIWSLAPDVVTHSYESRFAGVVLFEDPASKATVLKTAPPR